jgi:hypothetical protein
MSTRKPSIERSLKALDKAEPEIAAIAARVREEVGPGPRGALEVAALRGLRLVHRGDLWSVRLEGAAIVFGSDGASDEYGVFREVARWELRDVTQDEDCVLMLRDMLLDAFAERTDDDRRRDARVVLAGLRASMKAIESSVIEDLARVQRLVEIAQTWADGGPVPAESVRYARLVNAAQEQCCKCSGARTCHTCLANDALGEFIGGEDIEDIALRVLDWALGRSLEKDRDQTLKDLMRNESLETVRPNFYNQINTAIDAAEAAERAAHAA